jgi:hypothetical protein
VSSIEFRGFSLHWQAFPRRAWEREKVDYQLFREWSGADFPKLSRGFREIRFAPFPKQHFKINNLVLIPPCVGTGLMALTQSVGTRKS